MYRGRNKRYPVAKKTRKSCSETNTTAALHYRSNNICYDGYVKYEGAEIHRSAIMQDFRESKKKKKKKKKNGRLATIFGFLV